MIGIDVDGTLVGSSGVVDPAVWIAADRARAANIRLVLCSGRPAFGVALELAERLDADGWHSFQNGASIVHLGTANSRSASLPAAAVSGLIAQARSTGRLLELYSDQTLITESTSDWARAHAALLGVAFAPRPFETLTGPIVRAQWLVAPHEVTEVLAAAPEGIEAVESTSPLMPDTRFIGMTRRGTSKGSSMTTIAASYGIALDNVMYVGDAGNDLSALHIVGYPVAMANASAAVLSVAKRIVGAVDAAGVVDALELAIAD